MSYAIHSRLCIIAISPSPIPVNFHPDRGRRADGMGHDTIVRTERTCNGLSKPSGEDSWIVPSSPPAPDAVEHPQVILQHEVGVFSSFDGSNNSSSQYRKITPMSHESSPCH